MSLVRTAALQKIFVEIWLPQFRKSIVFETEVMIILTIIFYSVIHVFTCVVLFFVFVF